MKFKAFTGIMLLLLFVGMLTSAFDIQVVGATGTIYIRADGSVVGTDKIQRDGDVYTFTDNINDEIVVERSDITIDGNGYTLLSARAPAGFYLHSINNVTIKRTTIKGFGEGIHLVNSFSNIISRNNITANYYDGITLASSNNNLLFGNNIANNGHGVHLGNSSNNSIHKNTVIANTWWGISLWKSLNNSISGNDVANHSKGIYLDYYSHNNSISRNRITNNDAGIDLEVFSSSNSISANNVSNNNTGIELAHSSNNKFFNNSFTNNAQQVFSFYSGNVWDDGYPSGGNYWSDYIGQDSDGDGIGDSPYIIDGNNQDRYPLMSPYDEVPEDLTPPTTIHDYEGSWHTVDFIINLTAIDDLSGVAETYYRINNGLARNFSIDGQPLITTESANNKLEYWSIDNADNEELPHKILTGIKLDKAAPTGSVIINSGDAYATSTSVTLNLIATDATSGVYQIRFSNDGVWDTEPWETPSPTKTWTLTLGDGTKAVYYQIRDNAALISETYSDTITLDATAPVIEIPAREPAGDVQPDQSVKVSVNVTDVLSGVKNVTLSYTTNDEPTWKNLPMNYSSLTGFYEATIPPQKAGTWVKYKIIAHDYAGNNATLDGTEPYCTFQVIPEFPPTTILPLFMILSIVTIVFAKLRKKKQ